MIQGLVKIKSIEEYENAKKSLVYCISEYKWATESENPRKEIEDEIKACSIELKSGMNRDEEFKLLNKIHLLKTKYISIVRDKYKSALKRNINALVLMLEHFEASNQKVKFGDLIKGIIAGNPETKEYVKKKYMFTLANMYGTTPAPVSLNIESMDDILDYMDKNYELVDIDLSDKKEAREELGLTLFEEPIVGIKAALLASIGRTVDDCIENYKVAKPTKEEIKIALNKANRAKEKEVNPKFENKKEQEGEIDI